MDVMNARLPANTLAQFTARSDALVALACEFEELLTKTNALARAAGIRNGRYHPTDELLNLAGVISQDFRALSLDITNAGGYNRNFSYAHKLYAMKVYIGFGSIAFDNLREVIKYLLVDKDLYAAYPPIPPLPVEEAEAEAEEDA